MKKLVFAAFCLLAPLAVSANTVTSFNYFTAVDDYNPYLWLSQRYVTHDDCAYQDAWTLRIWRNAIYARHGYIFKSNDLYSFFRQYSWYNPRYSNVEKKLSKIERANVAFIKRYEY
ncbi:MAG: YARHG domain-containing protein [Bacteroidaceae bacterium]|nr:YARHG domain-containing protein [Bacteroidaceae bacterium]